MRNRSRTIIAGIGLMAILLPVSATTAATPTTVVVLPGDIATNNTGAAAGKWLFYNDETDTIDASLGSFVMGPGSPPAGVGSAQISVTGTQRRNLATYRFSGTPLASITTLRFSTYNPSAGNGGSANRSGYLHFNVDFNGSDTWQRRLVFVPSQNGTVIQDQWQEWDAIAAGSAQWVFSGATWPVTLQPGATLKTWSQILADYPAARIRVTDSFLGVRVGEPYAYGYTENIDRFRFGTASAETTFDFEPQIGPPAAKGDCRQGGWAVFNTPTFTSQGDCIQFVNTGR